MQRKQASSSSELRRVLHHETYRNNENHFLHRLHCVVLVSEGYCCNEVAELFGEHPRTVERWVHKVETDGIDGLKNTQKTGRPKKLSTHQRKSIKREINTPPWTIGIHKDKWTGRLLAEHIKRKYGVVLSERQCQRLLLQARARRTQ